MIEEAYHLYESVSNESLRHLWRREEKVLMCHSNSIFSSCGIIIICYNFISNTSTTTAAQAEGHAFLGQIMAYFKMVRPKRKIKVSFVAG